MYEILTEKLTQSALINNVSASLACVGRGHITHYHVSVDHMFTRSTSSCIFLGSTRCSTSCL